MEIDADELRRRINGPSTTPESQRKRCPECESVNIVPKAEKDGRDRTHPEDWYCENCREHFDDALEGEADDPL